MVRKRCRELLGSSIQIDGMLILKRGKLSNIRSRMEVDGDIQVGHHLPENIVLGLIVVKKRRYVHECINHHPYNEGKVTNCCQALIVDNR
jgi:hypothetical protein